MSKVELTAEEILLFMALAALLEPVTKSISFVKGGCRMECLPM